MQFEQNYIKSRIQVSVKHVIAEYANLEFLPNKRILDFIVNNKRLLRQRIADLHHDLYCSHFTVIRRKIKCLSYQDPYLRFIEESL